MPNISLNFHFTITNHKLTGDKEKFGLRGGNSS